jgi:hypothetical protein
MQPVTQAEAQDHPAARLARLEAAGGTTAEILALFDSLPPVTIEAMQGRWRGSGVPSGHPMDGLLERFGWYGKEFNGPEEVQPLLARGRDGGLFAVNPALVPIGLVNRHAGLFHSGVLAAAFARIGRAAATRQPTARLRMIEARGVLSAAMIYDRLPIIDLFRAVDPDTVLGLMDLRDMPRPFFFVLRRDHPAAPPAA